MTGICTSDVTNLSSDNILPSNIFKVLCLKNTKKNIGLSMNMMMKTQIICPGDTGRTLIYLNQRQLLL